MKKRTWLLILLGIILVPIILFIGTIMTLYFQQDDLVQDQLSTINKDFAGRIEFKDSHISPFERFPYISVDIEELKIFQNKSDSAKAIMDIKECFLGFDLLTILDGKYEIKSIELKNGSIKVVQDTLGEINLAKAFETTLDTVSPEENFHIDIKSIELKEIDLTFLNEENNLFLDAKIEDAKSKFKTSPNHLKFGFESKFKLDVTKDSKPTIMYNKNFVTDIDIDYIENDQMVLIKPSKVSLENGDFGIVGKVDLDDDLNIDLEVTGNKPNFDLFIAFAPEDLLETLNKYDNEGKIYFDAKIQGKLEGGNKPFVEVDFGCEEAFFSNTQNNKMVDDLFFKGHFTNGEKRDLSTMEFSLVDFSAKPEAGTFTGHLKVKNFITPEIDMKISSNFDLEFLANFLNIKDLQDLRGEVDLTMNFRDIVDLENPERSLDKFNQSYFTELDIKNLSFKSPDYHLRIKDIDLKATIEGNKAEIENFHIQVGRSDISLTASISDLPSVLHRTDIPVTTTLHLQSRLLDISELSAFDTAKSQGVDEKIENFNLKLKFNSSARAITESPNLPIGQFFIEDLNATFKHYPHTLHSFDADVFIEESSMRVVNLGGMIDSSDFKFSGICKNYDLWFEEDRQGKSNIFFFLESSNLKFNNLFAYGGENYVPEEYRHEEFKDFKLKGNARLAYDGDLKSTDIYIDYVRASMKVHPMRLERLGGRFRFADDQLKVDNFRGKLGNSQFVADMTYYFGSDKRKQEIPNHLKFTSIYINFNQLMKYNPPPPTETSNSEAHAAAWNIYELPFPNMSYDFDIDHMHYQKYSVENLHARLKSVNNQMLFIDTMNMEFADGEFMLKGVFSGADPNNIVFQQDLRLKNIDLDQLLYRFENFGQDHLVSDNLKGSLSGQITGKIRMYPDMVPIIDDSDIKMEFQVLGGRLEHYSALDVMSDYFKDKNLAKIIFDTLQNSIEMKKGVMYIPKMTINSSIGFIEMSGKQDMDLNMEYYLRIPMKMVTSAGWQKLFGKKKDVDEEQVDEIQYQEKDKKISYLNIKITGNTDDYEISLEKDK